MSKKKTIRKKEAEILARSGRIVWKKARYVEVLSPNQTVHKRYVLVKLYIPKNAQTNVVQATNRVANPLYKYRATHAKVLGFEMLNGKPFAPRENHSVRSLYAPGFEYRVNRIVRGLGFARSGRRLKSLPRPSLVCQEGIHFFLTRARAKKYVL